MKNNEINTTPRTSSGEHPTREHWMTWLYGEGSRRERLRWRRHLEQCDSCREQVARWQSAMRGLNRSILPKIHPTPERLVPMLKWAAAAMLLLGLGFGLGWQARSPARELARMRQEWQADLDKTQRQWRGEWETRQAAFWEQASPVLLAETRGAMVRDFAQFVRGQQRIRQDDLSALWRRIQELESQQNETCAGLRQDLEILALTAEGELDTTRRQLGNLAWLTRGKDSLGPKNDPAQP